VIDHPETIRTSHRRIACDGSGDVPAALGHPRVWLEIDESGAVDCGYCDRHFVLIGGPADTNADTKAGTGDAKAA
jgi:NADH dehydrogenase (ubiquinone) Fe-S protein 6